MAADLHGSCGGSRGVVRHHHAAGITLYRDGNCHAAARANIALAEDRLSSERIAPIARGMYAFVAGEANLLH